MKRTNYSQFILHTVCPMCETRIELTAREVEKPIARCTYCRREFKFTKSSMIDSMKEWKAAFNRMKYNNDS